MHYQHIIHRDIKPANLLLDSSNRVKISDLGVSVEVEDSYLISGQARLEIFSNLTWKYLNSGERGIIASVGTGPENRKFVLVAVAQ